MTFRKMGLLTATAICLAMAGAMAPRVAQAQGQGQEVAAAAVDAKAWRAGQRGQQRGVDRLAALAQDPDGARVIVRLDVGFAPEGDLQPSQAVQQRGNARAARDGLLTRMGVGRAAGGEWTRGNGVEEVTTFDTVPLVAMRVNGNALNRLLGDSAVASIEEDVAVPPTLAQSVPLVEANVLHSAGFRGAGWAVAVLDTGVDIQHPFVAGRIVSEACYSTTSGRTSTSLCPGGVSSSTAAGSGDDCANNITGCGHGTHVAGIAAGRGGGSSGVSYNGVAPDAGIIAVQVFSRFGSRSNCGGQPAPCVLSYTSDQIRGLERVFALRSTFNIAAVNMSLGGGQFTANCDTDSRKLIIDNLRSAGIATVIASGNNGYTTAVGAPSCISTAITVGSTTKTDTVSSFSNSSPLVELLAPGSSITSSYKGGYAALSGTSMATPHVAGAWALLKQVSPSASVTTVLNALSTTGKPVTDSKNGLTKPRIDVQAAGATFNSTLQ